MHQEEILYNYLQENFTTLRWNNKILKLGRNKEKLKILQQILNGYIYIYFINLYLLYYNY